MRSHVGWRGERSIPYKGVETSLYHMRFKTLRGSPEEKAQRGQYLLAVGLGYYISTHLFFIMLMQTMLLPSPKIIFHEN